MGRPKSKIDWKQFEAIISKCPRAVLADLHVAYLMKCSIKTLYKSVREHYGKSISLVREQREEGVRQLLYQRLMHMSKKGNFGATVWLTKNLMQWSDKVETKETNPAKSVNKTTVFNVEFGDGTPNDT